MPGHARQSPSTVAVTAGRPPHDAGQPLNSPILPASVLIPGADSEYARFGSPAWTPFEEALGALEGGHCVAFSSGQAAIAAVIDLVPRDGRVIVPRAAYSGTLQLIRERARRGFFTVDEVDVENTVQLVGAVREADVVWIETPTNPTLMTADLEAVCRASAPLDTIVVVDNTFATPLRQRPLELGADVVVHSASKLISGHSDVLLGAVVTRDLPARRTFERRRTRLGATPGVLEAFLATRGLRTLHVRLDRAEANAKELHRRLASDHRVVYARYPGFGTVISFEVVDGHEAAEKVTASSELVIHATSLGGVESTWERRRRHDAEPDAVPDGLIRLSVGIEDVEDIWQDVQQALDVLGR
ncbi:MAG TPA: aminotransferase class I/II-fold pyridoxal phosphate-dependent enzyme [Aeromicrobium sp.]|nr:aminotransferase class I/II-fold pyridoxal phosphate-dependent enzyme [Aeromicrobium sp.]